MAYDDFKDLQRITVFDKGLVLILIKIQSMMDNSVVVNTTGSAVESEIMSK